MSASLHILDKPDQGKNFTALSGGGGKRKGFSAYCATHLCLFRGTLDRKIY